MIQRTLPHTHRRRAQRQGARERQVVAVAAALGSTTYAAGMSLVDASGSPPPPVFALLGVLTGMTGVLLFLLLGGRTITSSGVYFLGSGLFGGFAVTLLATTQPASLSRQLFTASSLVLMSTLGTWFFYRRFTRHDNQSVVGTSPQGSGMGHLWLMLLGVGLFVAAVAVRSTPLIQIATIPLVVRSTAHAAVVCTAVAAAMSWRRTGRSTGRFVMTMLAVGLFVLYLDQFFGTFGRIVPASIALSCAMAFSALAPRFNYKRIVVVALLPALVIGGLLRSSEETRATDVLTEASGLGSVLSPIATFAELMEKDGTSAGFSRQYGRTFAEALIVVLVPRGLWPEQPIGFGRRLTEELRPFLFSGGHSMAAMDHGEWFVNFGPLGLALMTVAMGWSLAALDRWLARLTRRQFLTRRDLVELSVVTTLAGGLTILSWGGLHSYLGRVGLPALVAGAVVALALRGSSQSIKPT